MASVSASSASSHAEPKEKEDLSRMEQTYSKEVIGKLKTMDVFLIGLKGLGIETTKNVILSGPHSVTVHDDEPVQIQDLGTNFYLSSKSIGNPRGAESIVQLSSLNPNVNVTLHSGPITNDVLARFNVVVVTDWSRPVAELVNMNAFCRGHNIKFILASIHGVVGSVFVDFGQHRAFDPDGVLERVIIIDSITNDKNGLVTIDGDRHLLHDGDLVRFEEVEGMSTKKINNPDLVYKQTDEIEDINQVHEVKTVKKRANCFTIGDTSKLGKYAGGGQGTQVKIAKMFDHKPLGVQLSAPSFDPGYFDFTKMGRNEQLHLAYIALQSFRSSHGRLPALHSDAEADAVVTIAKNILAEHQKSVGEKKEAVVVDLLDGALIKKVALFAQTEFCAMSSLFGGVVAQEIIKQTGKYSPISQWLHFDALELIADAVPADAKPIGSRYDHQIALFGKALQDKLMSQRLFLVGCGALGCEYLKAIAMTGMGVNGEVHITDMDRIELSNLSRQFLFRRIHVNTSKSVSGAQAATQMNPDLNTKKGLRVHEVRVEPGTENIFHDEFWNSLDYVVNALDNIIARKYIDSKCVVHHKPLFESGTLGTQANSVIVLPNKTPSYSEGAVAGEGQGIAKCTLQNFPSLPLHCIEWAREMFDENFADGPQRLNDFLESPENFFKKNAQDPLEERSGLEIVKKWFDIAKSASHKDCVELAFNDFIRRYRDAINNLTHAFPKDARVKHPDTGMDLGPFWHGHKRFPQAVEFIPTDPLHVDYILHAANIYASVFNLKELSRPAVEQLLAKCRAEAWKPSAVKIDVGEEKKEDEKEKGKVSEEDSTVIASLKQYLRSVDRSPLKPLVPADFEKDRDENHHVDWITAATNLRSINYSIKPSSRATCRSTAGRIIPAVATTTACITGFVQLEIFKHVMGLPLKSHRSATIDLAVNSYVLEELPDPIKMQNKKKKPASASAASSDAMEEDDDVEIVYPPSGFTTWDKVVVNQGDLTLAEFCEAFPKLFHGIEVSSIFMAGLSDADVKAGKGQALYQSFNPFASQYNMAKTMLSRPGQSEANVARFKTIVDSYEAFALKNDPKKKLSALYISTYGPLPKGRNYLLLDGTFKDAEGRHAKIPTIQFFFAP